MNLMIVMIEVNTTIMDKLKRTNKGRWSDRNMESVFGRMAKSMKEIGKRMSCMGMEYLRNSMDKFIVQSLKEAKLKKIQSCI